MELKKSILVRKEPLQKRFMERAFPFSTSIYTADPPVTYIKEYPQCAKVVLDAQLRVNYVEFDPEG